MVETISLAFNNMIVATTKTEWLWENQRGDEAISDIGFQYIIKLEQVKYEATEPEKFLREIAGNTEEFIASFENQAYALEETINGVTSFFCSRYALAFNNRLPFKSNDPAERANEISMMIKEMILSNYPDLRESWEAAKQESDFPESAADKTAALNRLAEDRTEHIIVRAIDRTAQYLLASLPEQEDEAASQVPNLLRLLVFKDLFKYVGPQKLNIRSLGASKADSLIKEISEVSQLIMHRELEKEGHS